MKKTTTMEPCSKYPNSTADIPVMPHPEDDLEIAYGGKHNILPPTEISSDHASDGADGAHNLYSSTPISIKDDETIDMLMNPNIDQTLIALDIQHSLCAEDVVLQESSGEPDADQTPDENDSPGDVDVLDMSYNLRDSPRQIAGAWAEFADPVRNNYLRGCKWAPDGSCILTCSEDNILRLFNLPPQVWDLSQWDGDLGVNPYASKPDTDMEPALEMPEGGLIYDYCWYPGMNSAVPDTCCLAASSKDNPVHLLDAYTGKLRCSYRSYDQMDEIVAAKSISFDPDGNKLFCGFEKFVRVFNVDVPGRNFEVRKVFDKKSGQSGIISCFAFTAVNRSISVAGSYNKTIGIYSEPSGTLECLLEGQPGGVTHVQFSPDGNLLYSGGRKDRDILCWDMRNLGSVLYTMKRCNLTNQRMYFDISRCGRYIVSGNHNGVISIWDTHQEPKAKDSEDYFILDPVQFYVGHTDCVNGVSLHPTLPVLCSSSGQRSAPQLPDGEEDDLPRKCVENSLKVWWLGR